MGGTLFQKGSSQVFALSLPLAYCDYLPGDLYIDGSYFPALDRAFLQYTLIYIPPGLATNTYYRDKDGDGWGDSNDPSGDRTNLSPYSGGDEAEDFYILDRLQ